MLLLGLALLVGGTTVTVYAFGAIGEMQSAIKLRYRTDTLG